MKERRNSEGLTVAFRIEIDRMNQDSMAYLLCENLTKSFRRRRVVDQVNIEIRGGEVVGLLGPNGAGKTTIFYMIVGLLRPNE